MLVTYKSVPPFSVSGDFTVGTFHPNPGWCPGCGPGLPGADSGDVAIIVLSAPRNPGAFATLPGVGLVDTLAMKTAVNLVGYGTQDFTRGGGPPQPIITLTRFFAPSQLIQSNNRQSPEFIKLTANPAGGKGGVCFGDSGGPDVLAGTDIVLAVNSYVTNGIARGSRIRTASICARSSPSSTASSGRSRALIWVWGPAVSHRDARPHP